MSEGSPAFQNSNQELQHSTKIPRNETMLITGHTKTLFVGAKNPDGEMLLFCVVAPSPTTGLY